MSDAQISIDAAQPAVVSDTIRPIAKKKPAVRTKTELELLANINAKLDRAIAVIAAGQMKNRDQQVTILAAAGCDSSFIGAFVDLAPGRVRQLDAWKKVHAGEEDSR